MKATVLGAGIIGMWTAHLLTKAGVQTQILAAREPLGTTSAVAASVLTPFLPWEPEAAIFRLQVEWAKETLTYIQSLPIFHEAAQRIDVFEFGSNDLLEDSFHVRKLNYLEFSKFRRLDFSPTVVGNDFAIGYQCFLCDPSVLLPWLFNQALANGATFQYREFHSPEDLETLDTDLIFNCLGFNSVFRDADSYPVFGQSMFIPQPMSTGPFFGVGAGDHAIFRQKRGFYVGSYFVPNVADVLPKHEIYDRSVAFIYDQYPKLCHALGMDAPKIPLHLIDRVQTGVRPFRKTGTKIAIEKLGSRLLVHNTGHGAHGWTIGFASAKSAVTLALNCLGLRIESHPADRRQRARSITTDAQTRHHGENSIPNQPPLIDVIRNHQDIDICAEMMATTDPWKSLAFSVDQCMASLSNNQIVIHGIRSPTGEIIAFLATIEFGVGGEPLVEYLCVRRDHRNTGIGTKLMRFFEDTLFPDASNLYLFVSDINPQAARLYKRLGYEQVGALPDYNLPKQTEFLLRKTRGPKQNRKDGH
ncbi:MAG TPA: FAD-dependent oxidoreductase [Rhizomicrobium sp.]|nr:FAD-dependent oxidoreductase [Rhizomicrobium sp.]